MIKETQGQYRYISTGGLYAYPWKPTDGRPQAQHGVIKNEAGIASVYVDYSGPAGGPWTQIIGAETVRYGISYTMRQERTGSDQVRMTNKDTGIKRIVGRWLREL